MKDPSSWDVYLVTDRGLSRGRTTLQVIQASAAGGVSVVQLREKDLPTRQFYEEGLRIRDFLKSLQIPLIINDRIDIALALDADGVHVGQDDMPVSIARRILGPNKIIGLSINYPEDINEDAISCANYLAVSPVFATPTKEDITKPWGLDGLKRVRSLTDLPLVAIGGISPGNARDVVIHGADSLAVVSAIVSADDPTEAASVLIAEVQEGKRKRNT